LNYKKHEELTDEYNNLLYYERDISYKLREIKKDIRKKNRELNYLYDYILYGKNPPRTKNYSFIKKIKSRI